MWAGCTSPHTTTALADGQHTFNVKATDPAGNTDLTPATHTWTIDTSAPDTFIDAAPPDPSSSPDATFEFSSDDPTATFECDMDAAGWAGCTSPKTYTGLAEGSHTFQVRAGDGQNTDPTPATHTWEIRIWGNEHVTSGERNSIAIASDGTLHISYAEKYSHELKHAWSVAGVWDIESVDTPQTGEFNDVATSPDGKLHMVYYSQSAQEIKYAVYVSGAWSTETAVPNFTYVNTSVQDVSILVTSDGTVHLAYFDWNDDHLGYAKRTPEGNWSWEMVDDGDAWDSTDRVGRYNSIDIDSGGIIHISYLDKSNGDLRHAWGTFGNWQFEKVDTAGNVGHYTEIVVSDDDTVHISYFAAGTEMDLKYASLPLGGSWTLETVDDGLGIGDGNVGEATSIAVGPDGTVHIAYYRSAEKAIYHAWLLQGEQVWLKEHVFDSDYAENPTAKDTSIVVTGDGIIHITYIHYDSDDRIRHAWQPST